MKSTLSNECRSDLVRSLNRQLEQEVSKVYASCSLMGRGERGSALFFYDRERKAYRCSETKVIVSNQRVLDLINGVRI